MKFERLSSWEVWMLYQILSHHFGSFAGGERLFGDLLVEMHRRQILTAHVQSYQKERTMNDF